MVHIWQPYLRNRPEITVDSQVEICISSFVAKRISRNVKIPFIVVTAAMSDLTIFEKSFVFHMQSKTKYFDNICFWKLSNCFLFFTRSLKMKSKTLFQRFTCFCSVLVCSVIVFAEVKQSRISRYALKTLTAIMHAVISSMLSEKYLSCP